MSSPRANAKPPVEDFLLNQDKSLNSKPNKKIEKMKIFLCDIYCTELPSIGGLEFSEV